MDVIAKSLNRIGSQFLFIGLIVFFTMHAKNVFFELLPFSTVAKTMVVLCTMSFIYWAVSVAVLRSKIKASFFTAVSFFFFLFYNIVQSWTVTVNSIGLQTGDKVLLAICIFLALVVIMLVKITDGRFLLFLKSALVIVVCYEFVMICIQSLTHKEPAKSFISDNEQNTTGAVLPSVYLIVLDEYAGSETLQTYFKYSNAGFVNTLDSLGFKVIKNAASNYHYTVLSMASTFNGEYIEIPESESVYTPESFRIGMNAIYYNKTFTTFRELGYSVVNYSPFRIKGYRSRYSNRFLPTDYWLILHPTFFDRIVESFPYFFARQSGNKKLLERLFSRQVDMSRHVLKDVLNESGANLNNPTFSYVHLMMPHAPYATDSIGKINMAFLNAKTVNHDQRMDAYLQYLVYANRVVSEFLRKLKAKTNGNAVVMLMSDHGLRDPLNPIDTMSKFNTLNAVYLPVRLPNKWYDNMSNVNQFRLLFSLLTQQRIENRKDLQIH